jgi:hypothetical protein
MVADGREDGTLANRHGRRRQRPDSREAVAEITITSSHLESNIHIWRIKFAWCVFPIWLKIHYICNWWSIFASVQITATDFLDAAKLHHTLTMRESQPFALLP